MFKSVEDLRKQIISDYESSEKKGRKSFGRVVSDPKYKGMPRGTACTIYNKGDGKGLIPRKWLIEFGLLNLGLAPVCPVCKVVHPRRTCPKREQKRKRNRRAVNLDDPESGSETLTGHADIGYIKKLADNLTSWVIRQEHKKLKGKDHD